ncbi:hypothetical protein SADUNF_Sadunf16G0061000 [Salix dunnii]|uniref:Uncharacterized protein n=1 Tax=Salix dunnii TaxID=1413687 RepID=A0A835ML07_9ROSI|nr:hypothetical protein SADUNF_Sadunf16G0061000 [Salix dunnii]
MTHSIETCNNIKIDDDFMICAFKGCIWGYSTFYKALNLSLLNKWLLQNTIWNLTLLQLETHHYLCKRLKKQASRS